MYREEYSKVIERTSGASRFNIYEFSEILWLRKIINKRDYFVLDALFYFQPVQTFEYMGNMFSFGDSSYCASKGVCNSWRRDICCCGKFRYSYNSLI